MSMKILNFWVLICFHAMVFSWFFMQWWTGCFSRGSYGSCSTSVQVASGRIHRNERKSLVGKCLHKTSDRTIWNYYYYIKHIHKSFDKFAGPQIIPPILPEKAFGFVAFDWYTCMHALDLSKTRSISPSLFLSLSLSLSLALSLSLSRSSTPFDP